MHWAFSRTQSGCIWFSDVLRRQNPVLKEFAVNGGGRFQNRTHCKQGKHETLWECEAEGRLPGGGSACAESKGKSRGYPGEEEKACHCRKKEKHEHKGKDKKWKLLLEGGQGPEQG